MLVTSPVPQKILLNYRHLNILEREVQMQYISMFSATVSAAEVFYKFHEMADVADRN